MMHDPSPPEPPAAAERPGPAPDGAEPPPLVHSSAQIVPATAAADTVLVTTGAGPRAGVRRRHHWVVRLTHWVNAVALTVMVGSGLRIFNAYPAFARKGESFCCYPFEGTPIPRPLTFGGWLAGARHWHFAMMWVLAVNGLAYLGFLYLHGEWRDLVPRRNDPRDAWQMVKFYLFARKDHPRQGKHNALQKGAYFVMPLVGILAVLTGMAIWKPVQLGWLTGVFGGYAWARYWHFMAMTALVVLAAGHVFMVFAVDPYSLRSMITGGYDESLSPEERNARPFYHLRPRFGANGAARGSHHEP
jgi:Ni/Fe-hydrogenase b-type cytochrome subunit